jgi:hypothetical protein
MPVGHTHNDQDAKFSRLSVGLHGSSSLDTGRSSLTPQQWEDSVRSAFLTEEAKPAIVWMSVFDFDNFYKPQMEVLSGYGATVQYTREEGEAPRLESERRSHLRVALIRMDPGCAVATIRFAQSATAAERGEWYPTTPAPLATPYAQPAWCSLANHTGAAVLKALPDDEPTHVRYMPAQWSKYTAFQETLRRADGSEAWPPSAAAACRAFLASPRCGMAVPWDVAALRSAPQPAAATCRASTGERLLVVCPLMTATRTKTQKTADEAAAGCGGGASGRYEVAFSALELGDFAFALAHKDATNSFTLRVAGKTTPPVELLEIKALTTSGPRKARLHRLPAFIPLSNAALRRR